VNKQAGYIASAHLILAGAMACYFFISKIPFSSVQEDNIEGRCGTENLPAISLSAKQQQGKNLFTSKCASCHNLNKDLTGPALGGFKERGPWSDRDKLYQWIRNPEAFMQTDSYTKQLKNRFGSVMAGFPGLTEKEIDALAEYIN
jgi:cytochrome c1